MEVFFFWDKSEISSKILAGIPIKQVLVELNIRTQLKTWMKWYRNGELYCLELPVEKRYTFGKVPEYESEMLSGKQRIVI